MQEYNDYIAAVKRYLKNYGQFKVLAENMKDEIRTIEKELEGALDIAAPISKYGDEPGGGTPELNAVEAAAARRWEKAGRVNELERNINEIETLLRRVDRAMDGLEAEDRQIVEEFYFQHHNWMWIADKHSYSDKWARERGRLAVKSLAFMLFGLKSQPLRLSFVFTQ